VDHSCLRRAFQATAAMALVGWFSGYAKAGDRVAAPDRAAKFEVLYSFGANSSDAAYPYAGVSEDKDGNLFGTTYIGGSNNEGAVFKLAPDGTETVLYSFCAQTKCADGETPYGGVIEDGNGNIFGTTYLGGSGAADGTVYRLAPDGTETVLHSFQGGSDGIIPDAALKADKKGNLFGTTASGGVHSIGTVFEVTPEGTETILHSFAGAPRDGAQTYSNLVADKQGNFYGTTYIGGTNNSGVVFKLAPDGTETVLYSFCALSGCADGASPYPGLILDKAGNLYGTTNRGGAYNSGTVFKFSSDGSESVLHSFAGGTDGDLPYGGLVADRKGDLYGMTWQGGSAGDGTVFKVAPDGTEKVLHTFTGAANDGAYPYDGLIAGKNGDLYGTTYGGGTNYKGVVFRLKT